MTIVSSFGSKNVVASILVNTRPSVSRDLAIHCGCVNTS